MLQLVGGAGHTFNSRSVDATTATTSGVSEIMKCRFQSLLIYNFSIYSKHTSSFIILTTIIISLQIMFGYLGYKVMIANNYFKDFIHWKEKNPTTYALICPWVASVVFWFFFLHLWLVSSWVVEKFWIMYFLLLLPLLYIQFKTIKTIFILNKKFFAK